MNAENKLSTKKNHLWMIRTIVRWMIRTIISEVFSQTVNNITIQSTLIRETFDAEKPED